MNTFTPTKRNIPTNTSIKHKEDDQQKQHSSLQELEPITKEQSLLIQPIATIRDIVLAWQEYQNLKIQLLNTNDYQHIKGKQYIKKSGWRKIQTAFGISDEIIKEERKHYTSYFTYEVTVKATAPNGRYAYGIASCASNERDFAHLENDVRATAHTRAKNRAISDLVGGGEVSAEEMNSKRNDDTQEYHSNPLKPKQRTKSYMDKTDTITNTNTNTKTNTHIPTNTVDNKDIPITHAQKLSLIRLIEKKIDNTEQQNYLLKQIESITKKEASDMIKKLIS